MIGAEGELLILGEPGAGKTTLLLELARTLLERAEQDERLPIPIVFHLSSWAEKRQALRTWLVEELSTKYQVPRKIGQGWIDADQVLPLLDGLDEVAKEARIACVQQINDYYQSRLEHGSSPIVVCCRSEEYTALSTRIMLQHAVSILPLTDEQIDTYLEQAGEQVQVLRQALNEDTELRSLARQPLMLNIFTFAYQGAQASEVPTGATREETATHHLCHICRAHAQAARAVKALGAGAGDSLAYVLGRADAATQSDGFLGGEFATDLAFKEMDGPLSVVRMADYRAVRRTVLGAERRAEGWTPWRAVRWTTRHAGRRAVLCVDR